MRRSKKLIEAIGRVRQVISTMTYKPGWEIAVRETDTTRGCLSFRVRFGITPDNDVYGLLNKPEYQDALAMGSTVQVDMRVDVRKINVHNLTDLEIQEAINEALRILEDHERHEWLKFGGVHYTEPHPELQ